MSFPLPGLAGRVEDPLADGNDRPSLLGYLHEVLGRQQAARRVLPADEGLQTRNPSGVECDHRLVVELELIVFDGIAKLMAELNAVDDQVSISAA